MVTSKGWGCLRVRVKRGTYALIVDVQLPKKHHERDVRILRIAAAALRVASRSCILSFRSCREVGRIMR